MKKLISILLAVLIATSSLFVGVINTSASEVASGTCGDNLTWSLDDAGTLTITGYGNMNAYTYESDVPWYGLRSSIKTAVINDGVANIGNYVFGSYTNLTEVSIPSSVTSIGMCAFRQCTGLTEVSIPANVTKIGRAAFSGCSSLRTVNIPEGVTEINAYTFNECTSLVSVNLPDTVTFIGENAFYKCSILEAVIVPESVTEIEAAAFASCPKLTVYVYRNTYAYEFMENNNIRFDRIYISGDVNYDGMANVVDLIIMKRVAVGSEVPEGCYMEDGDMNKDDIINTIDINLMRRLLIGA